MTARPQRAKVDWAEEMAALLDGRYKHRERITPVCDNRNTHTNGAFDKVFKPDRARDWMRRLWSATRLGSDQNPSSSGRGAASVLLRISLYRPRKL